MAVITSAMASGVILVPRLEVEELQNWRRAWKGARRTRQPGPRGAWGGRARSGSSRHCRPGAARPARHALLTAHGFTPFAEVTTDYAGYAALRIRDPHRGPSADRHRTLCDVTRLLWRSRLLAVHSAGMVIAALDEQGRERAPAR